MPVTRRSTGGSRARPGPEKGQSTISFASRVTKAVPKDVKKAALSKPAAPKKAEVRTPSKEEEEEEVEETPVEEEEVETPKEGEDVVEKVSAAPEPAEAESGEFEVLAEKMTDAEIKKYWAGIMSARLAMPVHQEDLTVHEKILRYFDVSSQYGPSIGIDRTKRWKRAERLGLNPPIEVLAVLMKEHKKHPKANTEVSSMDEIMSHTAAGA